MLTIAYPNFVVNEMTIELWYEFFEGVQGDVFINAVKNHIRTSTFPPKVNELLAKCEDAKESKRNGTLKIMFDDGYFHKNNVSEGQAFKNYEKANEWLQRGVAPDWLKEDMKNYYRQQLTTGSQQNKLLT